MHYDAFNGDADGIIALLQLRWADPKPDAVLVTGVKRDIKLLCKVGSDATSVTALDISMEKNAAPLTALLNKGVTIDYWDHHRSGDIPESGLLTAHIDVAPEVCTSLLINQHLGGQYLHWAIAAAFGDNLHRVAIAMAKEAKLSNEQTAFLCELGTLVNYNGYGAGLDDLHFPPAELYQALMAYPAPFALMDDEKSPFQTLKSGYAADYQKVMAVLPFFENDTICVYLLPAEAWARRISGVFGNELANGQPDKAHAVLTLNPDGGAYTVSVRAPLNNRTGADEVCCQFPTGGGRKAAAGINTLSLDARDAFIETLNKYYQP